MTYSIPITGSYFCHNCASITWGVQHNTCEVCGLLLISAQEMYEHHVIKARACLAKHGVDKETATESHQQPFNGTNLTLFLTNRESAYCCLYTKGRERRQER